MSVRKQPMRLHRQANRVRHQGLGKLGVGQAALDAVKSPGKSLVGLLFRPLRMGVTSTPTVS